MKLKEYFKKYRTRTTYVVSVITLLGLVLRIICSFWGYPYQLHADEGFTVWHATDMLAEHRWDVVFYAWPYQVGIKACAFLFTIFGFIKYQLFKGEVFNSCSDVTMYFLIARFFSVALGTALIPLSAALAGRVFRKDEINSNIVRIATAIIISFSPLYIQHSAYATPNVPLAFFVVLAIYLSINYLEEGKRKDIYLVTVVTGIATMVKLPASLLTVYIAFIVIYKQACDKNFKEIFIVGFKCILILFATIFVIAPNMVMDYKEVINSTFREASNSFVGRTGYGYFEKLYLYVKAIAETIGCFSVVCFVAGIINLLIHRKKEHYPLAVFALFWTFLSAISLWWMRWGFPMYIGYMIVSASGLAYIIYLVKKYIKKKVLRNVISILIGISTLIALCNILLSAVTIAKWSIMKDTRVYAYEQCEQLGVTAQNSFYEAYTPFSMYGGDPMYDKFHLTEDGVYSDISVSGYQYFIYSSYFSNNYLNAGNEYQDIVETYNRIADTYTHVLSVDGMYLESHISELTNIIYNINLLTHTDKTYTGEDMYICKLDPDICRISPYNNEGSLTCTSQDEESGIVVSENAVSWSYYETDNGVAFIAMETQYALTVPNQENMEAIEPVLQYADGNSAQIWDVIQEEDHYLIIFEDSMALTFKDGKVMLLPYQQDDTSQWWNIER